MVIKVPSSNVAADMCSPDSLSLTSLVQQSSKSPQHHRKTTKISESDINFEFSYSAQSPAAVNKLHKKSPSNDLFELKLSQQSQVQGNLTMKDVLEPRNKGKKSASNKEMRNITKNQVGKYGNEENNSGGLAQKLMQSITTPCRSCSAVQPSAVVKRSNMVQDI